MNNWIYIKHHHSLTPLWLWSSRGVASGESRRSHQAPVFAEEHSPGGPLTRNNPDHSPTVATRNPLDPEAADASGERADVSRPGTGTVAR